MTAYTANMLGIPLAVSILGLGTQKAKASQAMLVKNRMDNMI